MHIRFALSALLLSCVVVAPQHADAQFRKLKESAKKAIEKKVDSPPAAPPSSPAPPAQPSGTTDTASTDTPASAARTDPKVWDNYDFVPGNRVLFYTDFSDDKVGNFAQRLQYRYGPMEVVERDGVKVFRATGRSEFLLPVGTILPQRFTLEIDIIPPPSADGVHDVHEMLTFEGGPDEDRGPQSASVVWMPSLAWITGSGQFSPASNVTTPPALLPLLRDQVVHVRVLMDGSYFKMYTNERRLYNIPNLAVRRDSVLRVMLNASDSQPVYLTRLRLAESETDVLYEALVDKGRWATQGILFATGKSELEPESQPVLKEIAKTMQLHGDLRIMVEGHTDNVGNAASNLALSDARAAAVKEALVTGFGIAADRIETQGFGDTQPTQPNTTAEGRAQNRRVEIVKLAEG